MNARSVSLLAFAFAAVSSIAPAAPPPGATITVNSTADSIANDNACTLREAIVAATTNVASADTSNKCIAGVVAPAVDTIAFDIPDTDPGCSGGPPKICTVTLSSPLPDISEPVIIDGYTQPSASANTLAIGDSAVILIRIDASAGGGTPVHLAFGSNGSTVKGLSIVKPGGDANNLGYVMAISSNGNTVVGNFIGVEPDGATVSTNHIIFAVLEVAGSSNTIGGTTPAARNLVAATNSGNSHAADIEGTSGLVQGNYFDLDATGSLGIGNAVIAINVDAGGNTIGGSASGAGNVIGTWATVGLQFAFGSAGAVSAQGNRIGTDASGTVALAGGPYGIVIGGSNGTVTIGGSLTGAGNLIRGTLNGIWVNGSASAGTPVIQGNHIGVSLDGTVPLPSGTTGIIITNSTGGLVGGTAPGEGNVIAFSGTNAISVAFASSWSLLGNSTFGNGFGISLAGSDSVSPPTTNDLDDPDTGNNNRQNYPVLGPGVVGPKTIVHVSGSLNSEANKAYRLEFFANAGCDKSGHGQGKIFVGTMDVTTNPNDVAFGPLALTTPIDRHVITATATDPAGNTSEFSDCSADDTIFSDSLEGD
jgi:CSLREA domain-containing protein